MKGATNRYVRCGARRFDLTDKSANKSIVGLRVLTSIHYHFFYDIMNTFLSIFLFLLHSFIVFFLIIFFHRYSIFPPLTFLMMVITAYKKFLPFFPRHGMIQLFQPTNSFINCMLMRFVTNGPTYGFISYCIKKN